MCDIYGKDQPETRWSPAGGLSQLSFPTSISHYLPEFLFKRTLHYSHLLLIGGFSCRVGSGERERGRSIICHKKIVSVLNCCSDQSSLLHRKAKTRMLITHLRWQIDDEKGGKWGRTPFRLIFSRRSHFVWGFDSLNFRTVNVCCHTGDTLGIERL